MLLAPMALIESSGFRKWLKTSSINSEQSLDVAILPTAAFWHPQPDPTRARAMAVANGM